MNLERVKLAIRIFKREGFLKLLSDNANKYYRRRINNYKIYENYLKNKVGLEIGGPTVIFKKFNLLPIYPIVKTLDGCNLSEGAIWQNKAKEGWNYKYFWNRQGYQYVCDTINLVPIKPNTYDFILSSHNIEHIANPFKAISEWLRVLKPGGVLLLVVPDKDKMFDRRRAVTSFEHLIDDFTKNIGEDDLSHLAEIFRNHEYALDFSCDTKEEFEGKSRNNFKNRYLHHHVFDVNLLISIFDYFNLQVIVINKASPFHIIIMGFKAGANCKADNRIFRVG